MERNTYEHLPKDDAYYLLQLGAAKIQNGCYKEALEYLNKANRLQPNNASILQQRGAAKQALGDLQGAVEDLNQAEQLEPNDAYTLWNRGSTKRRLGDYKGALEDLNRANKLQPNHVFTLCCRGATKQMLGDFQGALEDLNRANELQSDDSFTLQYRGATKVSIGDYEGALEDLNRADHLERNNAFALQQRAIARYYLEDYSRALDDVTRVLKQHPEDLLSLKVKNLVEVKLKIPNRIVGVPPPQELQEGVMQVPFSELSVLRKIGEGGFGEVILAEWRGIEVVLKKLKSSSVPVESLLHEAKTLMMLRYKFIVLLMGFTMDPQTNELVLMIEYMKHGSLEDLLFKHNIILSRSEVIRLALDIAMGLNYLHSHNPKVIHRDLKSANVLLHRAKRRGKIADFGTAKFLHQNVEAKTVFGNISIAMPPEMLAEEVYDERVDVFALGVILYEMLTNKRLPVLNDITRNGRIDKDINDKELRELVLLCCAPNPDNRGRIRDIIKSLRKMKEESK